MVTHLTTSPPVRCLNGAERTGSLVLNVLWSNVKPMVGESIHIVAIHAGTTVGRRCLTESYARVWWKFILCLVSSAMRAWSDVLFK
jgi:hypothetical protein